METEERAERPWSKWAIAAIISTGVGLLLAVGILMLLPAVEGNYDPRGGYAMAALGSLVALTMLLTGAIFATIARASAGIRNHRQRRKNLAVMSFALGILGSLLACLMTLSLGIAS